MASVRGNRQTSPQEIAPDAERVQAMFLDKDPGWQKGTSEPMHMINFLQFVRPGGLQAYAQYGKHAVKAVTESAHTGGAREGDGNGLLFPMVPSTTPTPTSTPNPNPTPNPNTHGPLPIPKPKPKHTKPHTKSTPHAHVHAPPRPPIPRSLAPLLSAKPTGTHSRSWDTRI